MPCADCRKCRHFVPYDVIGEYLNVPTYLVEDAVRRKEYLGEDIKGVCLKRMKPVTHYRGKCRYYETKHKQTKQLTLFGTVAWVE